MKKHLIRLVGIAGVAGSVFALVVGGAAAHRTAPPQLTLGTPGTSHAVHVFPTAGVAAQLPAVVSQLTYHGGPIMKSASIYAIFWKPASGKLQDGTATSLSTTYKTVTTNFLSDYHGHSLANNNTQYSQNVGGTTTYITSAGSLVKSYIETANYPVSGCASSLGPNCITDAQIQAEVAHAMSVNGWTASPTKIFMLFTSKGENSCFDTSASFCAYTYYCAYHGAFGSTIYSNEPYADSRCQSPGSGQHFPTSADGDASANLASHELTEAITDPQLNAWFDASGEEIGDKCAWNFGSASWDGGLANEMWNGRFYDLQLEWDNHASGCVDVGP
jgi:hypothetical protein